MEAKNSYEDDVMKEGTKNEIESVSFWESEASHSKADSQPLLNMNAQPDFLLMPKDFVDLLSQNTILKNVSN